MSKARTSDKYCPVCEMKRRGNNHDNGSHHKAAQKVSNK